MKMGTSKGLPPAQQADVDALAALSDADINLGDMPEVTDWSDARRRRFRWVLLMCLKAVRFERLAASLPRPFSRFGAVKSVKITGVHTPHPMAFRQ